MSFNGDTSDNINLNYPVAEYTGYTDKQVDRITYIWIINYFSFCDSVLESPQFPTGVHMDWKWSLYLKQNADNVSLYLRFINDMQLSSPTKAKYKFFLLNAKGEKSFRKEENVLTFFKTQEMKGFDSFISRSFLMNKANGLVFEDKVRILCEIDVVVKDSNFCGSAKISQLKEPEWRLSEDLGNLLNNGEFSDVTLVVGDYELPAHKAILASRSEVFAAMFKHQMKEQQLNRVSITDFEPDVVKEILRFIYTGKAPNIGKMAGDLLAAADKYALDRLKLMCEKTLCIQLSTETAAESLIIAHLHTAHELKAKAISFISTYANEVTNTQNWKKVIAKYSELITEELVAFIKK